MGRRGRKAGINFLNDPTIAKRITEFEDFTGKDVLEIGPGLGQLTTFIKNYRTLTIIEREKSFAERLKASFPEANVVAGDALKVEWPTFQIFVSNMPYSISSPLLEKLWNSDFEEGIVTVQKEVADRITAVPGTKDYSRLSVMMQLKFNVERKFDIPPSKFTPQPNVFSTVLKLRRRGGAIPDGFDRFLRLLFSQRRKKIRNVINSALFQDKRSEELSVEELLVLFEKFSVQQQSL
jgi:16S rRNA (adenine1518-N6/adenine1519-N6)-dimethyltransferase